MKIIAHRGANKQAPQNTVPAFRRALEIGVDGFENDVHLTKDDRLVVCHNYEIDETSTGSGKISDYTLEELRRLDFGSYFSPDFAGTKIPTLEEFLELCGDLSIINIEIKKPQQEHTDIARKTIKLVKDFGLFDNLIISSFDDKILLDCKECDKKTRTGFLYSLDSPLAPKMFDRPIEFAKELDAQALHPMVMYVDEDYIADAHAAGIAVHPWTVNLPHAIQSLLDWGCDAVITDLPDVAREIVYPGKK